MAEAYAPYTARFVGPDELERGIANTIRCPVYRSGSLVAPSGGTVTIKNASNIVVVNAATVTVTGSIATYTVSAGTLSAESYSSNWIVEWALTISGETFNARNDAVLVYRALWPVITDADLLRVHTDIARLLPSTESSAQDYIDEAWAQTKARLLASGQRPELIMSPSALRPYHLALTLAIFWGDLGTEPGSAEWNRSEMYRAQSETEWGRLTYPQAERTGGPGSSTRRRAGAATVWLGGRG